MSAIQREAHMHTKSFVVVRFCFVTPPGLELNLTSSAYGEHLASCLS